MANDGTEKNLQEVYDQKDAQWKASMKKDGEPTPPAPREGWKYVVQSGSASGQSVDDDGAFDPLSYH